MYFTCIMKKKSKILINILKKNSLNFKNEKINLWKTARF